MANNNESTMKWKVDISQLKTAMQDAKKSISLANAEFKAATAGMDKWQQSTSGLEAKLEQLNKTLPEQKKILADLESQYKIVAKEQGENSSEAKRLQIAIENQKAAITKTEASVDKYNDQLVKLKTEEEKSNSALGKLTDTISKQETELNDLKNQYANAVVQFGKNSSEAKTLANNIDDLSSELAENKTKLSDAEKAADELDKSIEDAADSAENAASGGFTVLKGALANLVSDGISRAIGGMQSLAGEAMDAMDSLAKFEKTMGFAGFDDAQIEAAREAVKNYADKTVYDLDTIANTTAQLAANGIEDFSGLTEAAGNLNAVAGGNADTFQSVAMVLTQTAGAGKLTTENWNQLANAIPGASGVLMDALREAGAYTGDFREAMAKGEITADEFNEAIMKVGTDPMAVEAATSVDTFEGAMGNLKANVVSGFLEIYETIGQENITGFINAVSKGITKIMPIGKKLVKGAQSFIKWCKQHLPAIQALIIGIATAMATYAIYTTVLTVMKNGWMALTVVQKAAAAAQMLVNAAMAANPIGIVIALIAGLVAAFVVLWNKSDAFREFWIGLWNTIKDTCKKAIDPIVKWFREAWDKIKEKWDVVKAFFEDIWTGIKNTFGTVVEWFTNLFTSAWNGIKAVWDFVVAYYQAIWDGIVLVFTNVATWFSEKFTAAWNGIKAVWDLVVGFFRGIWNGIKTIFTNTSTWFTEKFTAAWNGIKGIWDAVKGYFQGKWDDIKNVFGSVNTWLGNKFGAAWTAIKNKFSGWASYWSGLWDKVKDKFTGLGTTIGDAIGDSVKSAINTVITLIENTINGAIGLINKAIKIINKIPKVDIDYISELDLPRLARGGVVNGARTIIAGEDGAEAIVPLENNTQWIRKVVNAVKAELKDDIAGIKNNISYVTNGVNNSVASSNGGISREQNITFNQVINSPKAVDRLTLYRETNSLLFSAKVRMNNV